MKIITAGVTSALLAAGVAGSVAAYRTQAAPADLVNRPAAREATVSATRTAQDRARPQVRWAPCPLGSTLEKGTCVTHVVRTVVLPVPSLSPATAVRPSPVPRVVAATHTDGDDSVGHESPESHEGHDDHEGDEGDED